MGFRASPVAPLHAVESLLAMSNLGKVENSVRFRTMAPMRAWYKGCAVAFQATDVGSSPTTRSTFCGVRPAARTPDCQSGYVGSSPTRRSNLGGLVITAARTACTRSVGIRLPGPPPSCWKSRFESSLANTPCLHGVKRRAGRRSSNGRMPALNYGACIRAVQEVGCEPTYECSTHSRYPKSAYRPNGKGTGFLNQRSEFESLWAVQFPAMVQRDRAQASEA